MFVESYLSLKKGLSPTVIYVFSDDEAFVRELVRASGEDPVVVATSNKPLQRALKGGKLRVKRLAKQPAMGIATLKDIKDLLLASLAEGLLKQDDLVLCVVSTDIQMLMSFHVRKLGISSLMEAVGDRVDHRLMEVVMNIASQIAVEGKEGKPSGALFIVGDCEDVLKNSRELIKNPFHGHGREGCRIFDERNLETVKEFALLDGALVVDDEGYAVAAGRYVINISFDLMLSGGLGGRHLAGASISRTTKAVAVVVSSTGTVRAFKDGEEVYKVGVV